MNIKYVFLKLLLISGFLMNPEMFFAQKFDLTKIEQAHKTGTIKDLEISLKEIDTTLLSKEQKPHWYFYFSILNNQKNKEDIAFDFMTRAKQAFIEINAKEKVTDCNLRLIETLISSNTVGTDFTAILNELENKIPNKKDYKHLRNIYRKLGIIHLNADNAKKSIYYFKKIIPLAIQQKDCVRIGYAYGNIAIVHGTTLNDPDSSLYYNKKATPFYKKYKDTLSLAYNYNNQAQQYKLKKEYQTAIDYFLKADSIPIKTDKKILKLTIYENLAEAYSLNKNYFESTKYLILSNQLKDSLNLKEQGIAISEIKEKYDNEKLRADNLEIDAKRKKNKSLLIYALGIFSFSSITFLLVQKNTKKKQRLAEKDKELETQKLATVLKEQELTMIDAMVAGQEKERQRIANDLHDDLGSLLANVRLHFDALKENKSSELYSRTDNLISETYQKVRSLSHAKNSGVIAKHGLLKSVQNMADKISQANTISIQVFDYELNERLENNLEITVFRIIQELITNTLKHAEATEIGIHLTNHGDTLNILFEDDGIGFDSEQILSKNKGMGIDSIDKRVDNLNGTMDIDSSKNQGTTFIINIPL